MQKSAPNESALPAPPLRPTDDDWAKMLAALESEFLTSFKYSEISPRRNKGSKLSLKK